MDSEGELELLGKFSHVHEAELARSALEAAGIDAVVQHGHGGLVGYGTWVTVWVPAGTRETAREALAEESRALELPPEEEAEEAEESRRRKVSRGANYLLLNAVFCVMLGTVVGIAFWPVPVFAFYLVEALVFTGLYLWARWDPYPALVTGTVLFALGQVAGFLMDVPRILGRIGVGQVGYLVWTVVFLAAWIVAIREARPRANESTRS